MNIFKENRQKSSETNTEDRRRLTLMSSLNKSWALRDQIQKEFRLGAWNPILDLRDMEVYMIKGSQDWEFFGFDFEICIISLLIMSKY